MYFTCCSDYSSYDPYNQTHSNTLSLWKNSSGRYKDTWTNHATHNKCCTTKQTKLQERQIIKLWCDRAEWVESRLRHFTGFMSFILFQLYVNVYVKTRHLSQIHVSCYIDLTTYVMQQLNIVRFTSAWFQISLIFCVKNNLKPVTCRYQLSTHFASISHKLWYTGW